VTGGGTLPCRWVVHAVGPRWGEGDEERKLRSAVAAALDTAAGLGALSVAVPAISTGIFGYPKAAGTRHIADEAVRWARDSAANPVEMIHLAAFDRETAELFAVALNAAS
jgi:O-acetyl-ADP-ribose deacetylase (regulator of RNase III)